MGKRKEINGEYVGKKLFAYEFDEQSIKNPARKEKKFLSCLNRLRDDDNFKKQWENLWTWRFLEKKNIVRFFRVHSFLRNDTAIKKRLELEKKKNLKGFYEYSEKHWYISPADVIRYSDGYQDQKAIFKDLKDFFKTTPLSLDDICSSLSDSDRLKISSKMQTFAPWIVQASKEHSEEAVTEIFNENNFSGFGEELKKFLTPKEVFEWAAEWQNDLIDLCYDVYYREPIICLKVNLRRINSEILDSIKKRIDSKRNEIEQTPERYCFPDSWEIALMIWDLDKFGFTDEDIQNILLQINSKQCIESEYYVKDKLKLARKLIENSIVRDFPFPRKK